MDCLGGGCLAKAGVDQLEQVFLNIIPNAVDGTGLGLSVSYDIGAITCSSIAGDSTTFKLSLAAEAHTV